MSNNNLVRQVVDLLAAVLVILATVATGIVVYNRFGIVVAVLVLVVILFLGLLLSEILSRINRQMQP